MCIALSRGGCELLGKTCVETSAFAHNGTKGGGGPGGALSQSPICSMGSVLLFIHCFQRDNTTAFQLTYQSCHHLEVNSMSL